MRSIDSGVQALLAALTTPKTLALVYIPDLSLRLTTWTRDVTWGGVTWTAPVAHGEASGFEVTNLTESLDDAIPEAGFRLHCVDGTQQARFWIDAFRERLAYVKVILAASIGGADGIVYPETPWQMDADSDGRLVVTVRLQLSAARQQVPHRTTQESHCEHEYGPDAAAAGRTSLCPYRGSRTTCDFTLLGPNGCQAHFPDVDGVGNPWVEGTSTGPRYVVPLPYGGSPSGLDDRLVV